MDKELRLDYQIELFEKHLNILKSDVFFSIISLAYI